MTLIPINIAVEDRLSEAVLRRILLEISGEARQFHVGTVYGRSGFGYLKRTINGWNAAARQTPYLVLTDLDTSTCPSALVGDWFRTPIHPNMIFRVAVREVEAWLLADIDGLCSFLKVRRPATFPKVELLLDPKATLVGLAETSRSAEIRRSIVPRPNTTAQQGPLYNVELEKFVTNSWNIAAAIQSAASLNRAVNRLMAFQPTWHI